MSTPVKTYLTQVQQLDIESMTKLVLLHLCIFLVDLFSRPVRIIGSISSYFIID